MTMEEDLRYGTVEHKVRHIVARMHGVRYMFKNWAQANEAIDRIDGPTVIYILPPAGTLEIGKSRVRDIPTAQIAFVASSEFDFDGGENDNIIERMRMLCIEFLKAVNESGDFEPVEGEVPYQVLYDHFDENVTGIVITPRLVEEEGIALCYRENRRPYYD